MNTIILAGGCFWGMEDLFRTQQGVTKTEVGYTGGENENPTYQNHPGHAEAIKLSFNPQTTDADKLLDYFFQIHNPTTKDRQGNDIGSSYRSTIFYADEAQKATAQESIERNQTYWPSPIVTTLEPLTQFWSAEDSHQEYLQKNPGGYTCHFERTR